MSGLKEVAWEKVKPSSPNTPTIVKASTTLASMPASRPSQRDATGSMTNGIARILHIAEAMVALVVCADPVTDIRRIAHVLVETGLPALMVPRDAYVLRLARIFP